MYGQGGNDLLIGDGSNASGENDTLHLLAQELDSLAPLGGGETHGVKPESLSDAILGLGNDELQRLADWSETKLEKESDGNDWLFGGEGDDVIFGLGGDDRLYGGSGNDIIKYDDNDFLVDGGDGIDFLITENEVDLDELLTNTDPNKGPIVKNVEVLISGEGALSLTDTDMLKQYGIELGLDGNKETLTLSDAWEQDGDRFVNHEANLTIQVSGLEPANSAEEMANVHKFILENA